MRDWEQAPYQTKLESDANYKRMLEFATRAENARVVRVGVASHNLFDVAYALLVRKERGVENRVEFEMLEGMANAQALEVCERSGGMTVYTPAVPDKEFEAAVAYLVRRLDENTAPGQFSGRSVRTGRRFRSLESDKRENFARPARLLLTRRSAANPVESKTG